MSSRDAEITGYVNNVRVVLRDWWHVVTIISRCHRAVWPLSKLSSFSNGAQSHRLQLGHSEWFEMMPASG
jgi:hypothetical protein